MSNQEQRASARMRKYLGAKIEFNDRQSLLDCIVRNQSEGGFLLNIESPVDLPLLFDLHINKTSQRYRCRLAWNGSTEAGVRSCSVIDIPRKPILRPVA